MPHCIILAFAIQGESPWMNYVQTAQPGPELTPI